ncbi:hypothetical protein [Chitinivorax sp. B]|uniref:hypothetical protein n=1 Tax=Chitinivorax sp. B TaxID=2502235 RepID=UPI0010F4959B|nr:hypothetical protein [Chitinivorax sp. B]
MLSRLAANVLKTTGGVLVGVAVDRTARGIEGATQTNAPDPMPRHPPMTGTGNERLHQVAVDIAPSENANPISDGFSKQVENRVDLLQKMATVAQNPVEAMQQLEQGVEHLKSDLEVARGAVKVVGGQATINPDDVTRVAKAGVQTAANNVAEHLRNMNPADAFHAAVDATQHATDATYVAATTSQDGIQEVIGAAHDRAKHEMTSAMLGMAETQALAMGVAMLPFPGAPIVGGMIGISGAMSTGAKVSEVLHDLGGSGDQQTSAMRQEMSSILKEKARE